MRLLRALLTLLVLFNGAACRKNTSSSLPADAKSPEQEGYVSRLKEIAPQDSRCPKEQGEEPTNACVHVPASDPAVAFLGSTTSSPTPVFSGTLRRVLLPTHAQVGQGYTLSSGALRGIVLNSPSTAISNTSEGGVSYDLTYIDRYEELARSMNLSVHAAYSGMSGGFSASMNLFKSAKFSSTKAYILVRMTVVTGTEALNSFNFSPNALERLSNGTAIADFTTAYGDTFITQIVRGAELFALMEFSADENKTSEELKVEVSGKYGGFSASASLATKLETLLQNKNVRVIYSQTGGGMGRVTSPDAVPSTGGVLAIEPKELLGRIRELPGEARAHPEQSAILWGQVLDFNAVENRPRNFVFPSNLGILWALDDLGRTQLAVDEVHNTATEVANSPLRYAPAEQETARELIQYSGFLRDQLGRFAESVSTFPSADALLRKAVLPSLTGYRELHNTLSPGAPPKAATLKTDCPAAWAESRVVVKCLFPFEKYEPREAFLYTKVVAGVTSLGGCNGHHSPCHDMKYDVYFDPTETRSSTVLDLNIGPKDIQFESIALVTADPINNPDGLSYSINVLSVEKDKFVVRVRQTQRNNDGNFGWNRNLQVRWSAYVKQP